MGVSRGPRRRGSSRKQRARRQHVAYDPSVHARSLVVGLVVWGGCGRLWFGDPPSGPAVDANPRDGGAAVDADPSAPDAAVAPFCGQEGLLSLPISVVDRAAGPPVAFAAGATPDQAWLVANVEVTPGQYRVWVSRLSWDGLAWAAAGSPALLSSGQTVDEVGIAGSGAGAIVAFALAGSTRVSWHGPDNGVLASGGPVASFAIDRAGLASTSAGAVAVGYSGSGFGGRTLAIGAAPGSALTPIDFDNGQADGSAVASTPAGALVAFRDGAQRCVVREAFANGMPDGIARFVATSGLDGCDQIALATRAGGYFAAWRESLQWFVTYLDDPLVKGVVAEANTGALAQVAAAALPSGVLVATRAGTTVRLLEYAGGLNPVREVTLPDFAADAMQLVPTTPPLLVEVDRQDASLALRLRWVCRAD